ncbi:MAG: FAD-dependent oxidoreductase, partial [Rhodospirillaceae bacterium]
MQKWSLSPMESADCIVIGAGAIGLAIARAISRKGREVLILEAADDFGTVTSSRNSEVIHAGIFYEHGSLKERLCIAGRDMMYSFCDTYGVPYRRTTKLVYAQNDDELPRLRELQKHASAAGVHMTWLSRQDAAQMEPQLQCA